jgi:predicted sulfurtransferase
MTGIAEYLAELASDRDDEAWFQLAFVFEQRHAAELEAKRENERRRYRIVQTIPDRRRQSSEEKRAYMREYARKRREANPEAERKRVRDAMARSRAARAQEEARAA